MAHAVRQQALRDGATDAGGDGDVGGASRLAASRVLSGGSHDSSGDMGGWDRTALEFKRLNALQRSVHQVCACRMLLVVNWSAVANAPT